MAMGFTSQHTPLFVWPPNNWPYASTKTATGNRFGWRSKAPWDQQFNALVHECLIKKSHDQWNPGRLRTGFAQTQTAWVFFVTAQVIFQHAHNASTCCPWKENDVYHMDVGKQGFLGVFVAHEATSTWKIHSLCFNGLTAWNPHVGRSQSL